MDREKHTPAPNGARSDHLERLRLLVTLQNQIVELAQRNQVARQDCARLSEEITQRATATHGEGGWGRTAMGFLQQLREVRRRLRGHASKRPNGQPAPNHQGPDRPAVFQADAADGKHVVPAPASVGAENRVETAPPPALRSAGW